MDGPVLNQIRYQRKAVGRARRKIVELAKSLNSSMPDLVQDLTAADLYLDGAEDRLLKAETRIEDAKRRFKKLGAA